MDRQVDTELHNKTSSDGQADSRRGRHERWGVEGDSRLQLIQILLVQDYGLAFSFSPSVTHRDEKKKLHQIQLEKKEKQQRQQQQSVREIIPVSAAGDCLQL